MDHRLLGRTGVSVSKMCLGAMMFGAWGNPDHDESIRIIHAALDAGINFIDTADVYAQGESEEIVGKALKGRRDEIVLATKFHGAMGDDPNRQGSSRRWIIRAVEDSLRRLDTDWIDLYQVHRPRTDTDVEETLGALTDLVHQGKVRYIGASTFPASQIVEAQWVARERGLQRFVTEQPAYSILVRRIEDDILPTCQRHGMGVLSYSPLTGGWLSGRWRKDSGQQESSRASRLPERFDLSQPANQRKLDAVEALAAARRRGRHHPDPDGDRLRAQPPSDHVGDHRTAHHGAARRAAGGSRCRARRRRAGPDRRDRRARHHGQPGGQLLRQPGTGTLGQTPRPVAPGQQRPRAGVDQGPRRASAVGSTLGALAIMPNRSRRALVLAWVVVVLAAVAVVIGYVLWGGQPGDRPNRAQVSGTLLAAVLLVPPVMGWAWTQLRRPAPGTSTPDQVDTAVDLLGARTFATWSQELVRRGIQTPAPVRVRWRWAADDVALPRQELASSTPLSTDPKPLSHGEADDSDGQQVLNSGLVTRPHEEVYGRLRHGKLVLIGGPGAGKTGAMILLLVEALQHRERVREEERSGFRCRCG